jgi:hypothetical protein
LNLPKSKFNRTQIFATFGKDISTLPPGLSCWAILFRNCCGLRRCSTTSPARFASYFPQTRKIQLFGVANYHSLAMLLSDLGHLRITLDTSDYTAALRHLSTEITGGGSYFQHFIRFLALDPFQNL